MTTPEWRCACVDRECIGCDHRCQEPIAYHASCLITGKERRLLCQECADDLEERDPGNWKITEYGTEWPHGALNPASRQPGESSE